MLIVKGLMKTCENLLFVEKGNSLPEAPEDSAGTPPDRMARKGGKRK